MLNHFIGKNHNFSSLEIIILNVSLSKNLFININNIPIHIDLFLIIIILSIRKLYPQIFSWPNNVFARLYTVYTREKWKGKHATDKIITNNIA